MRSIGLLFLLMAGLAHGQDAAQPASRCNVVARTPDLNAAGEFVRPPATAAECETAATLEAKFLATRPSDFRQVRNMTRLPEPVRVYIEGIDGVGAVRNPVTVQVGRYPDQRPPVVIWLGTELVVIAYRVSDFSGSATNVVLADVSTLTACAYLRWSGGDLPADLTIARIQRSLDQGLLGDRETPACHLRPLTLE